MTDSETSVTVRTEGGNYGGIALGKDAVSDQSDARDIGPFPTMIVGYSFHWRHSAKNGSKVFTYICLCCYK